MVGHQHIGVVRAVEDLCELMHVDIALVGPDLDEVVEATADIAKVHVEDLLALREVFDDRRQFLTGVFQAFGSDAAAEVKAVSWPVQP